MRFDESCVVGDPDLQFRPVLAATANLGKQVSHFSEI